jgi:hypothetical protein
VFGSNPFVQRFALLRNSQIAASRDQPRQRGGGLLQRGLAPSTRDDRIALLHEPPGQTKADAAGAAGDQDLVESQLHVSLHGKCRTSSLEGMMKCVRKNANGRCVAIAAGGRSLCGGERSARPEVRAPKTVGTWSWLEQVSSDDGNSERCCSRECDSSLLFQYGWRREKSGRIGSLCWCRTKKSRTLLSSTRSRTKKIEDVAFFHEVAKGKSENVFFFREVANGPDEGALFLSGVAKERNAVVFFLREFVTERNGDFPSFREVAKERNEGAFFLRDVATEQNEGAFFFHEAANRKIGNVSFFGEVANGGNEGGFFVLGVAKQRNEVFFFLREVAKASIEATVFRGGRSRTATAGTKAQCLDPAPETDLVAQKCASSLGAIVMSSQWEWVAAPATQAIRVLH